MLKALNEIRALKDPLKQNQVEFVLCEYPALKLAQITQKVAGVLSGNTEVASEKELHLRCTSFNLPGCKIGQTELILQGMRRKDATIQNRSGTWTCTITEDFDGSIGNILQAWCDLIHAPLIGTRLPSNFYYGLAQINIGGTAGTKGRTLYLKGLYPISVQMNQINTSSSDPVEITVTWNYNWYGDQSYSVWGLTM